MTQFSVCPRCCNFRLLAEGDNIYDVFCPNCGLNFCFKCGKDCHFPALCEDLHKWNNPDSITDLYVSFSIDQCKKTAMKHYDELLNYLAAKESGLTPDDLYVSWHGVNHAFDELRGLISYLKWVHVHLCFNSGLAPLVSESLERLHTGLERLVGALPSPGVPPGEYVGLQMLKKYRLDLVFDRNTFSTGLHTKRVSLMNPPPSESEEEKKERLKFNAVVHQQLLYKYFKP